MHEMHTYSAFLSGAEDATSDYSFALTGLSISKRDGILSYYSASAQWDNDLVAAFAARPNGKVHILRDGAAWEYFNQSYPFRYTLGPGSGTITLNGTRQETNTSPASLQLDDSILISSGVDSSGQTTFDIVPGAVDPKPGDSVAYDPITYTIILVKLQVSGSSEKLRINTEVQP